MITLSAMNEAEFADFLRKSIGDFAADCIEVGRWPAEQALGHAKAMIDQDLPAGMNTPDHLFYHLMSDTSQQPVGYLWLQIMVKDNLPTLYVCDIEINLAKRRQGLAQAAFLAIERLAKERGIDRICLHVFRHNQAAHALYQKLGFSVTGLNMLKQL